MSNVLLTTATRTIACHLADGELIQRLQNVQKAKKNYLRSLDQLRAKLNRLIDRDGIKLNTRDSRDMQDLCKGIAGEVRSRFGEGSFIKVLWEQQLDYHTRAKKQGMRWHPLIVRFALNLKYLSSNAYKAVNGFISLPSERTL